MNSAQSGYYPVYLFREDMNGAYLSLNQAKTEAKSLYRSDAKTALHARAANFRAMLGKETAMFPELEIDLAPSNPSNDAAYYEAGNVCAKLYTLGQVPDDVRLTSDLREMLRIYNVLVETEAGNESRVSDEGDEPPNMQYEDGSRFRLHKRIERNTHLSKQVKKLHGHTCQVCNISFERQYGSIGKDYIEAHHLRPLSSLKGQRIAMDPKTDFAVLCSNCHRMVHRSGCIDDIARFTREHYRGPH
jgi:5-methylcytosine-specific restriction protein A